MYPSIGLFLHKADSNSQKPFVLVAPVERVLRVVRTIPSVNLNVLVGRHLPANIALEESHHSAQMLAHTHEVILSGNTDLPMRPALGLGFSIATDFSAPDSAVS